MYLTVYKWGLKSQCMILCQVKALDVNEGVSLVQRLVGKQDKAKVWKHRLKIADLAIQIFLATTIVKKYNQDFWYVDHQFDFLKYSSVCF